MASDPPVDLQYAEVKCKECGKEYVCTPDSDYYNATTTTDGVCFNCLVADTNISKEEDEMVPLPPSPDEAIGIRLRGGPAPLDGWSNAYSAAELWGWPPPDELMAVSIGGRVAIAIPANVPDDMKDEMTLYRKVEQSNLPDEAVSHYVMRGAVYEVVSNE